MHRNVPPLVNDDSIPIWRKCNPVRGGASVAPSAPLREPGGLASACAPILAAPVFAGRMPAAAKVPVIGPAWQRRALAEVEDAAGTALSEKLVDSLGSALKSLDLEGFLKKKTVSTRVAALVVPVDEIKKHANYSSEWLPTVTAVLGMVWTDFLGEEMSEASLRALQTAVEGAEKSRVSLGGSPKSGRKAGARARFPIDTPAKERAEAVSGELDAFAARQGLTLEKMLRLPWPVVRRRASEDTALSLGALQSLADMCGGEVESPKGKEDKTSRASKKRSRDAPEPEDRGRKRGTKDKPDLLDVLADRLDKFEGRGRDRSPSRSRSHSSSASSSSSLDSKSSRGRRKHRRRRKSAGGGLHGHYQQLQYMLRDPVAALSKYAATLSSPDDWPLTGRASARVAPWLVPQIYQGARRGREWAVNWVTSKHLLGTPTGATVIRYGMAVDLAVLYDGPSLKVNPLMLASLEVVCRDLYGIMKAYEKVLTPEDLKPGKKGSKVKWAWRDRYDVATISMEAITAPHADRAVAKEMRRDVAAAKLFGGSGEPGE